MDGSSCRLWVASFLGFALLTAEARCSPQCGSTSVGSHFPPDVGAEDVAGIGLAVDANAESVFIGSPEHVHNGVKSGSVTVVTTTGTWELLPTVAGDWMRFGYSVATNAAGTVVAVGAPAIGS